MDVYDPPTGGLIGSLVAVAGRTFITFDTTNQIDMIRFNATALRNYLIAIDGFGNKTGPISFSLTTSNLPPAIVASSSRLTPGLAFNFSLASSAGVRFALQASTNLTTWSEIYQGAFASGSFSYADTNYAQFRNRFYRVVPLP